ncbi:MAG: hypothetical protein IPH94_17750 [Saprospiraceae bacterium]|nr:hypothetical protein [Saprospiraceae bacterium]
MGIIGWRLADFGRWMVGAILLAGWLKWWPTIRDDGTLKRLFYLLAFLSLFLLPSMVLHTGLSGHRYLLPIILVLLMIAVRWIFLTQNVRFQFIIISLLGLSLLTGHCWIYPKGIAQGWDASLAHWPYFELRSQMNQYMDQNKIDISEVGCSFPNLAEQKYLDLSPSTVKHANKDLLHNSYFLYSNLYNDVSTEDFQMLENDFNVIHSLDDKGIYLILYQRKR